MEHEIRHDLEIAQAQLAARSALDSYAQRFAAYSPEVTWKNESEASAAFTIKGLRLTGDLKVESDRFRLNLDVPFVLRPFKGKAFAVIEREVGRWMTKAKSGEI